MAIRVVPFTPDLLPAVIQFSEKLWKRPRSDAYYRWRYLGYLQQMGLLALRDGECLAMVWAFPRPYRIGLQQFTCLEALDWFCLPELRKSGLGIRLMHTLMKRTEPMVVVGGSPDTQSLLPALGWKTLGKIPSYILPLQGAALGERLHARFGIPSALVSSLFQTFAQPWFYPKSPATYPDRTVQPSAALSSEILGLYTARNTGPMIPLPEAAFIQWLTQGTPYIGTYLLLEFRIGQEICGWSLSRTYSSPAGREARIIELFSPDDSLYAWIVNETIARLLPLKPDTIHAATGHPSAQKALKQARFLQHRSSSVFVWPKNLEIPGGVEYFAHNTSDAPFLPYNE